MSQDSPSALGNQLGAPYPLPRVTIQFCTQCKWMLRAAYVRICSSLPPLPPCRVPEMTVTRAFSRFSGLGGVPANRKHRPTPGLLRYPPQFAQELLSTFSTSLGEVALQPSTGGTFVVEILFSSSPSPPYPPTTTTTTTTAADPEADPSSSTEEDGSNPRIQRRVLWDRHVDGGFPETKELKRRVRDAIEPGRHLGHVDRDHARPSQAAVAAAAATATTHTQDAQPQSQPVAARGEEKDGADGGGGGSKQVCEDCQ